MSILSTRTPADDDELARLEDELTQRCADLRPPIVVYWPQHSLISLDRGIPWWLGPAECDPHRDRRGRLPMPQEPRARLQELAARRLPFQRVAVAHELDPAGPVRDLLPSLWQGPLACTAETARSLVGPPPAHPGVRWAARLLEMLASGTGRVASRLADVALDPIVFGVVAPRAPRPGDATLWFALAVWRW